MTARLSKAEAASLGPDLTVIPAFIELPWPSRDLHPNARVHWAVKGRAAKKARQDAAYATKATGVRKLDAKSLLVTAIFNPPDNRHRDLDGMLASMKSSFDGIADTIGVDDSKWAIVPYRDVPKPPHGAVLIQIEVLA